MSGTEIAALITACGMALAAILTAIAALRNSANSKEVVEKLKGQIAEQDKAISTLKDHNAFQDRLLLDRETKIDALTRENKELRDKINKWQEWGLTVGRLLNETQLEVGYLMQQSKRQTAPLTASRDFPQRPSESYTDESQ